MNGSLQEEGDKVWLPPLALACEPCCPSGEAERQELRVTDPGGIVCNPKGGERGARPSGEPMKTVMAHTTEKTHMGVQA